MPEDGGTFSLGPIGQIAVTVDDVERARDFYRDTLGMAFLFDAPGMAFFDAGGVRLMLARPEAEGSSGGASILYFRVEDIEEAHRALDARGVPFEAGPRLIHETESSELWMAFFRDPEGNLMALMSEVATG